ncbi:MAG TPA: hypothetical protein DCY20_09250 [Firmicutes bacterium]|nr:hypothetical protein [Bacillota bacterium]
MRGLNPLLYNAVIEWSTQLPKEFSVSEKIDNRDNINNKEEEVVAALLTEFPCSYRQAYEAYFDLLQNDKVYQTYFELDKISVLALGTGSGGDVFGLIHALERFYKGKQIKIFTVEGNELALLSQVNIYKTFFLKEELKNKIELIPIHFKFERYFDELQPILKEVCQEALQVETFDIIQSFKLMNEGSISSNMRFFDLYRFINKNLAANRVSVILENADPTSKYIADRTVAARALIEFTSFAQQYYKRHQLHVLTPTPCIARCLSGLNINQCHRCTTTYEEVKCYVLRMETSFFEIQSTFVYSMKLATGELGHQLVEFIRDDSIAYQTKVAVGQFEDQYCTLNARNKGTKQTSAFKISQSSCKEV